MGPFHGMLVINTFFILSIVTDMPEHSVDPDQMLQNGAFVQSLQHLPFIQHF